MASFFVSRVDTETDKRLDAIGTDEAKALKGKAAVANARLAYQAYEEVFSSDRWAALEKAHANKQRPLWASTGVKDPSLKDTMYVEELVAPNTVNTMPEATLEPPATTARSPATRCAAATSRPAPTSTRWRSSASRTTTSCRCWRTRRREVRGVLERPAQVH